MLKRLGNIAAIVLLAGTCALAQTPEDLLRQAQTLEKEGKTQKAIETYQAFLKQFPDHTQAADAGYRLARCYDDQGLVDETIAQLKAVLAHDRKTFRNRADAQFMLGKLYGSLKDHANAVAALETLLSEGAGLYEDEALNLLGGHYAAMQKYDEAAAKFNILKLRRDSPFAQQAAYKLAVLWLKAGKIELAIDAAQDLAGNFPAHPQIPELLLRLADAYRAKGQFDKTISICEQLKSRYPRSIETLAGSYLLGLCYRDRKEFDKAVAVLDQVGRVKEFQGRGLAADALLAAAEIYFADTPDLPKAMQRYEEAARLARESDSDRKNAVLEQCYFRLAEYHFARKQYSVALEYYLLLRNVGTNVNITGRILQCQAELKGAAAPADTNLTSADVDAIRKRIADHPGTAIALEAEVFLLDRKLAETLRNRGNAAALAAEYRKLLTSYKKDVLQQDNLEAYIWAQTGTCHMNGTAREDMVHAIAAFEKLLALGPPEQNPYATGALEGIALAAERMGDKPRAMKAYYDLLALAGGKLDANKADKDAEKRTLEYLKSIVTRCDSDDLILKSIALCNQTIEQRGPLSDLSREARYYLGDLHYLRKDYSSAAAAYKDFIRIYGPKQDAEGNLAGGPWKPPAADAQVQQLFEAAIRVAHCWYMQHNHREMLRAYEWIVRNFPNDNPHVAEAQYYLALELGKSGDGESRRRMADALWANVVNPSQDFEGSTFRKSFHPWVRLPESDPSNAVAYVKNAILRAGQTYGEINEHELAARMFEQYLALFGGGEKRGDGGRRGYRSTDDEQLCIARYALGREYIALGRIGRMIEVYRPYLSGQRDDRFRVSALKLMGFHAGKMKMWAEAVDAYATLLDEYGPAPVDARGNPMPVPLGQRLRAGNRNWDGMRLPAPRGLDLGEIRYALGFLYWKQEEFGRCAMVLEPFAADQMLAGNKHRPTALFMAGQSALRLHDYESAARLLGRLVRDYPRFEAIEEAYEYAARSYAATKQWDEADLICRKFVAEWPNSGRRPRIDLYGALAAIGKGRAGAGMAQLKALAESDADQDVKADALYHLGSRLAAEGRDAEALAILRRSIAMLPREYSCLAAGKCAAKLKDWPAAREMLDRAARDFPRGDPTFVNEAKQLLPTVLKELAKSR